ncbi:MAG: ferritin [Chthoniobacterales bacterium]
MLISQAINDAVNEQIGYEFGAMMQYFAIAAHFEAESLPFLSKHFFNQGEEEKVHALKFIKFVLDAGGRVEIPKQDAPKGKFTFAEDAVKMSLEQEIRVTERINALMDLALKENNHIASTFLQWFVIEQLEEVSAMDHLLKIVQRAGEGQLLLVEQYLGGNKTVGGLSVGKTQG